MTASPSFPAPRWTSWVRLSDLRPAVRNPKEHDLPSLVESIQRYGWTNPILVCGRTERIAGGHGRLAALVHLKENGDPLPDGLVLDDDGEWCVPVSRGWSSRNDAELEAYIVLDNQLTIAGGWNDRVLAEMLHDLNAADPSLFDAIGFTADEMDDLFKTVDPERFDQDPDALPSRDTSGAADRDDDEDGPEEGGGRAAPKYVECPMCFHQFDPTRTADAT